MILATRRPPLKLHHLTLILPRTMDQKPQPATFQIAKVSRSQGFGDQVLKGQCFWKPCHIATGTISNEEPLHDPSLRWGALQGRNNYVVQIGERKIGYRNKKLGTIGDTILHFSIHLELVVAIAFVDVLIFRNAVQENVAWLCE